MFKLFLNVVKQKIRNFIYFKLRFLNNLKISKIKINNKILYLSHSVDITHFDKVVFGSKVFIWHFTILDSYNGIKLGDGVQIGTRVGIFTHSSHNSIRYYVKEYHNIYFDNHKGRLKGSVEIGDYTFIGANSIIMPKTTIGKGCIISAFSYVQGDFPDFSIISGNPAKIIGDVKKIDHRFLSKNLDLLKNYQQAFDLNKIEEL